MSIWDLNSISSLFQEQQEKSQMYSQNVMALLTSPEHHAPPDREATGGFSQLIETINFNDIEKRN